MGRIHLVVSRHRPIPVSRPDAENDAENGLPGSRVKRERPHQVSRTSLHDTGKIVNSKQKAVHDGALRRQRMSCASRTR
jgi:hypothetical protein